MWDQVELALRESLTRVITKLAVLLPGVVALVLVIVAFTSFAALLSLGVRRLLTAMKFDHRATSWSALTLSEWSPGQSPTALIAKVVFWTTVLIGFLLGFMVFDASNSGAGIAQWFIPFFAHIVGAIVMLVAGNIIARFLSRSVLIGAVNMKLHYARLLASGVKWLVLVLAAAMALDHLFMGGAIIELAFGILFGGIVLTLSLAIGLGSKDVVSRSLERERTVPYDESQEQLHHL
jgi:hypothetical protein